MDTKITKLIEEALSEVLERPVSGLKPDTKFDQEFDLDSYLFVQFLLSLEDRIPGLRFDPDAIGQYEFNVAATLVDYVVASTQPTADREYA